MTEGKTYYQILGISSDAEDIVIRAAYRVLAQKYHPDKWRGDPLEANHRMRQLNEAYETLSDAARRSVYDSGLRTHWSSGTEDRTGASDAESERHMRPEVKQAMSQRKVTEGGVWSLLVVLTLGLSSYLIALGIGSTIDSKSIEKNTVGPEGNRSTSRVIADAQCRLLWTGEKFVRVTLDTFPAKEFRTIPVRDGVVVYYERYVLRDSDMLPIIKKSETEVGALCHSGVKE